MIASVWHDWFGWPNGAVLTNLIAAVIGVAVGYMIALRHFVCMEKHCLLPGVVPVRGTVHHVCKKHAIEKGHTH